MAKRKWKGELFLVFHQSFWRHLLFLLLSLQVCSRFAVAGSAVKFLPGFDGPLPFELETGYIGVDESEDVQLFYYFVKSGSNPELDPVVLWITGGPGCTSLTALVYELGPIKFEEVDYNDNLPKLVLNPNSWTEVASFIFLDLPVGTGFSYARTPKALQSNTTQTCDQAYQFLRKFLIDHPEFISNPFYVGGDSFSGLIVPILTEIISEDFLDCSKHRVASFQEKWHCAVNYYRSSDIILAPFSYLIVGIKSAKTKGNENGIEPWIDLKGYLLGNPVTTPADDNYRVPFTHGMGLISDEIYESLNKNCEGKYQDIDPSNLRCSDDLQAYSKLVNNIQVANILEPNCGFFAVKPHYLLSEGFDKKSSKLKRPDKFLAFKCRVDGYKLSYSWANDDRVREALHIHKGSIGYWERCNLGLDFITTVRDCVPYHANLSSKGYRSLVYSGDHDFVVPFLATQAWIRSLNYSIVDDWRQWVVHGQVAGYTRTYANQMAFATVKGGGHTAPEYRPAECKAMFKRWISHEPL